MTEWGVAMVELCGGALGWSSEWISEWSYTVSH